MAAPDDLTARIGALLRAADGSLPEALGVAVSGGGDSLALLMATREWAAPLGIGIQAATVDHGLREGSAAEARHVAAICADIGVAHAVLPVGDLHGGTGLQARARAARYAALAEWAARRRLDPVLLGHTADDVAETFLMRLRRGTGLDGLAEIPERHRVAGIDFARPFLGITRARLRADLDRRGLVPLEDPSNGDDRFERARVRKAMAALELDPEMIARSAAHLRDAAVALEVQAAQAMASAVTVEAGDLIVDGTVAATLPREVLRRILLAGLGWVSGAGPVREAAQRRLLDAMQSPVAPFTLAGCLITADRRAPPSLRIAREWSACAGPVSWHPGIGWDGRWRLTGPAVPGANVAALGHDVRHLDWRATGLPRASLMASPAVRTEAGALIAAPLAGLRAGFEARSISDFPATSGPAASMPD